MTSPRPRDEAQRPVLVAPDSFKGTYTATEVAAAIGRGLETVGLPADICPVADGGEGTYQALAEPLELKSTAAIALDPLGRRIPATFGLGRSSALIEVAAASGLTLVQPKERDAFAASSYGTGQLIAQAIAAGAKTIYVAAGGSATTDGGAGAIDALDAAGIRELKIVVLCDVRTSFLDAPRIFGPQKGATQKDVTRLTARLEQQADLFVARYRRDPREITMAGAAGGLAGGLWAAYGASLLPGSRFVLDAVDFDRRMASSQAVVTGEGRLDPQSLDGKLISEVAIRAKEAGAPCYAIVGSNALDQPNRDTLGLRQVFEAHNEHEMAVAGRAAGERLRNLIRGEA